MKRSSHLGILPRPYPWPGAGTAPRADDFRDEYSLFDEVVTATAGETGLVQRRRRNRHGIAQAPGSQAQTGRWRAAHRGSPTELGSAKPFLKSLRPTDSGVTAYGTMPLLVLMLVERR